MSAMILHGDCRELLRAMESNSFDSVVTDPPYEYSFMNARWDGTGIAFDVEMWKEIFRVLKPGAWGVVFGADRRVHRVMCAIEDAGFVLRHLGTWVSAQVFPKSLDASKAVDARLGKTAEREVIGSKLGRPGYTDKQSEESLVYGEGLMNGPDKLSARWNGYGTALKTMEPWVLIRKPMVDENGKPWTLAENLMRWGVGALNIDGARLPLSEDGNSKQAATSTLGGYGGSKDGHYELGDGRKYTDLGRWPSALICSDLDIEGPILGVEVFGAADDDLDGVLGPYTKHFRIGDRVVTAVDDELLNGLIPSLVVCPKVGPGERDLGCDLLAEQWVDSSREEGSDGRNSPRAGAGRQAKRRNTHPTVKPISLMRHLIRMVTPAGGKVLDTFSGSAAGGMAAVWEGMDYVGCELMDTDEQPFVRIGRARLEYALRTPAPPIEARVVKTKPVEEQKQTGFEF